MSYGNWFQFDNAQFQSIEIDGLKSDESRVIVCKNGYRIVGIENSKNGVFIYGTGREATISQNYVDTATALTNVEYPMDSFYNSAEVI